MMRRTLTITLALLGLVGPAAAKNVDLVTLPGRETVQLTIYNSEDLTLVKETRSITLKKGANELQFSWAGTLIDPSSVEFRPLTEVDQIDVIDTVFPGQKPQHLFWRINSQFEGQVTVEVSYFTSGLTWSMDYVAVTDPGEDTLRFDGYVRVSNRSGEEYDNAEVRLIVGTVNLVEKIAELAQRQGIPTPQPATDAYRGMRRRAGRAAMDKAENVAFGGMGGMGMAAPSAPKEIVKEGLSEYFMFAVEGTETIRDGWSKRMPAVRAEAVKFDILYRMRAHQYGPRPVRFFIWANDAEHELGDSPLPDGRVRLFRRTGRDGLTFLSEQQIRYVPIKAKIEINLGADDLVVLKTRKMSTARMNFDFRWDNRIKKDIVVGWDEQSEWVDAVRNYRSKPITFELRRRWNGDIDFASELPVTLFDVHTVEATFTVPARNKLEFPATVVNHLGSNKKQNRIRLK